MARNEGKAKSVRRALRDVSNNHTNGDIGGGGGGRFSKSVKVNKKWISEKQIENQKSIIMNQQEEAGRGEEDHLDRLLLVQSDLSSITRQIDELVAQAFKMKASSKQGRREIESFSHVLSDMLSSLKTWAPRLEKAFSTPASKSETQLGQCSADKTVSDINEDENFEVDSPEQTRMNSLISPSPLVSWRPDCNIERSRQLFLLTPLPISKTLSSKHQDLSKSVFERIASNPAVELPSFLSISGDLNDDLLEGIATKPTPNKPSDSVVAEAKSTLDSECVSPPIFSNRDRSILVMTPCLKMSPPKSCVLLEPISESSHKGKAVVWKSTPFPVGIHSQISESFSDSVGSENLTLKYPELMGIQRTYKSRMGKKELEASPNWFFSPPKTCVLLEPPDEKSQDTVANENSLSKEYNDQVGCHEIRKSCNQDGSLTVVESTPIWKEPASTMRRGKRPGENTLKKELWTKFEAASTYGIRLNVSALQRTAQKGFLDMLDEVSRDGESPLADCLR